MPKHHASKTKSAHTKHRRRRAQPHHHVSNSPAAPSPAPSTQTSAFAKLRPLILILLLVVLLGVLFVVWNIFQRQQQAQYSITSEDLQHGSVFDRLIGRSPSNTQTPTQENAQTGQPLSEVPAQVGGPRLGPNAIAQGQQIYTISTSGTGPAINRLTIDEFDPPTGSTQGILVEAQYNQPIDAITATIQTDTTTQTHQLAVVEGDNLKGVWAGQWPVADTHDTIYTLTLTATSTNRPTSTITLSFR